MADDLAGRLAAASLAQVPQHDPGEEEQQWPALHGQIQQDQPERRQPMQPAAQEAAQARPWGVQHVGPGQQLQQGEREELWAVRPGGYRRDGGPGAAVDNVMENGGLDELPGEDDEDESAGAYYFIRSRPAPKSNLYTACRVGDLQRVRYLVEEVGQDLNRRDDYDSVPLYHACLGGHVGVVGYLLEAGAVCNEYTFDGDRCHYAALTLGIRELLRQYEARPPPLAPLAAALRATTPLCQNAEAATSGSDEEFWQDFVFWVGEERMPVHRAVLAARSPFFRRMFASTWAPKAGRVREVRLAQEAAALRALVVWAYTERLDVAAEEVPALQRLAKTARCAALLDALRRERSAMREYKTTRPDERAPRRVMVHPGSLPDEERLAAHLHALLRRSQRHAASVGLAPADDYADVALRVQHGERTYRCHRVILAAQSEYFQTLFRRSDHFGEAEPGATNGSADDSVTNGHNDQQLPILDLTDVSAEVFEMVLEFIYTDQLPPLGRESHTPDGAQQLFAAADMYLLFSMKRAVADSVIADLEARNAAGREDLERLCRLALVADTFSVMGLRSHCLARLALYYDDLACGAAADAEPSVLEAFILAIAPSKGDIDEMLDGSDIAGASKGDIEGGGVAGLGVGTLLQDFREAYLEAHGGSSADRDKYAKQFDDRLLSIASAAWAADEEI